MSQPIEPLTVDEVANIFRPARLPMNAFRKAVQHFLDQRDEYVRVLRQTVNADADYHRWQGHAESRRQLSQTLENAGVDLSVEPSLDLESGDLQDRLAQACGDPGSIVGRQHHIDESLPRWQMRAVLHVLAEVVAR